MEGFVSYSRQTDTVREEGQPVGLARVEQRLFSLEENFHTFKELSEQQQKARICLLMMAAVSTDDDWSMVNKWLSKGLDDKTAVLRTLPITL